ncbi:MAG TPA: hypothetical protein VMZ29_10250 [Candidatus Bathyarchaeia archaeon]|nr:hypothetical protein [Candidatus Bathyarchaeia archaeon]
MISNNNSDDDFLFKEQSDNLQLIALKFVNGFFITICEKTSLKLGTTAISLPYSPDFERKDQNMRVIDSHILDRRGITTTTILGSRNELFAKALAEKVVQNTSQLVYLTLNYPEKNEELFVEAIKLVEKFIQSLVI